MTYAQQRLRELVRATKEIERTEDGGLCGRVATDTEGSWEAWCLYQNLPPGEAKEIIEEYEERSTGWYSGPGRGFAHAAVAWELPGGSVLITQDGGLDI